MLVIFVDTWTTAYFIHYYKLGIDAEDNIIARIMLSQSGWYLIIGIKALGVSAEVFVAYSLHRTKYLPKVNVGLAVITSIFIYAADNNLTLVLKLLLR